MKVIILAAGLATRLGNLTEELHKDLFEVNGKSILERQLMLFKKFGKIVESRTICAALTFAAKKKLL